MSYVFYPGCSLEGTARDFGLSVDAVAGAMGLELPELPDWTCCGSTAAHQTDPLLAAALPAETLFAARGHTVAVACASCYNRLKAANHEINRDEALRRKVTRVIGSDYDGQTPVMHILEILARDLGADEVASRVAQPLTGLKVACYYGCLLTRPPEVTHFDDPENPMLMDNLLAAAGTGTLDWPHKTECCGASASITDVTIVHELTREVLSMARAAGANCMAVACPLCQINLDMRQKEIEDKYGDRFGLPVFYFTQLLGLAMGLEGGRLGLDSLVVDPAQLLTKAGISTSGIAAGAVTSEVRP
jgi:heterodisulfide reductase subunit B